MTRYVWDASAVLVYLRGEPGVDVLETRLAESSEHYLCAVNLSEVAGWLNERGMPAAELQAFTAALDLQVVAFDRPLALATGLLRTATKARGLSLGDRACLALAKQLGATALTADRAWLNLALDQAIELTRPATT
ncbi:type II toxin-antitoxin system VapC family toxin [Pseudothauera lacus]|uniref:VapC toxin family PIN domain ribonuclease n=1 Tax=Pseudothauera lacus TaxID=2136175 RepID=A0A2T4IKA0_9RHOO|nr:type II toxin-antitoxin system VapC family toxin [Pseudothauera lacus]PTD98200.1 VapC toxin family PIN domain ribonuclease [Pseudothauera lacus]